ncbi:MAG TPA: DegT/DnrJ/EryC1/StrS family aminotransferase [Terriglobales bacterium]|jgi:dTDP-4-amino-4,6-dideoxygalactose transaminase|nr:DegT/DnrJ/EryC1/StrS family aminotransferase [Terriglobales bacterium]
MSNLAIQGGKPVRTKAFPVWPVFGSEEEAALLGVLRSGEWWKNACGDVAEPDRTSTAKATHFARQFAEFHNAKFGIPCSTGSAALEIALKAMGIGPGDEVIVPPYTFIATATAPLHVGATPIFCDIDPDTYCMDPAKFAAAITPRTRAVIPVHFAGVAADMEQISAISRAKDIAVLEDAAHAHGGTWRGEKLGSLGLAGTFSFQFSKNMTAGEGGVIVTNDAEIARLCESYVWGGRESGRPWYEHHRLGWNYRLSEFHAAVLGCQLERLEEQTQCRMKNGVYLASRLSKVPGVRPLRLPEYATTATFHIFVLRFDEQEFGLSRQAFLEALEAEGVPCSSGYAFPLYKNPLFVNHDFYPSRSAGDSLGPIENVDYGAFAGSCPAAETACQEAVWLEQRLLLGSQQDIDDVVRAVEKIWQFRSELQPKELLQKS